MTAAQLHVANCYTSPDRDRRLVDFAALDLTEVPVRPAGPDGQWVVSRFMPGLRPGSRVKARLMRSELVVGIIRECGPVLEVVISSRWAI